MQVPYWSKKQAVGQISRLAPSERSLFVAAVKPLYDDAKTRFEQDLRDAAGVRRPRTSPERPSR